MSIPKLGGPQDPSKGLLHSFSKLQPCTPKQKAPQTVAEGPDLEAGQGGAVGS